MTKNVSIVGRLVNVRSFEHSDISDRYVSWLNDSEVVKYSNQRFVHHTVESCVSYYESFKNSPNYFLSVCSLDDGSHLGTMTVYVSPPHQTADIGILIGNKEVWGRGIGQDAWNAVIKWLSTFHGLRKATGGTLSLNKSMIKIMEHSGMKLEAVRVKQEVFEGEAYDLLYFAKFFE